MFLIDKIMQYFIRVIIQKSIYFRTNIYSVKVKMTGLIKCVSTVLDYSWLFRKRINIYGLGIYCYSIVTISSVNCTQPDTTNSYNKR